MPGHTSHDSSPLLAPGATVAKRYRISAFLGRGGMGEVYRADDLKLGEPVALKFLPREFARDRLALERLVAEVRTARRVVHPSVCRVYDISEIGGRHFLSMEYVDGEDLSRLLRRIGRLPAAKALQVTHELCNALAAIHGIGILHRDLKPSNIMIDGRGRARLTDFGLAIPVQDAENRRDIAGTPGYMAFEQLLGEPASVRSDLYALGVVLYELYTGHRPYRGASISELRGQHLSKKVAPPTSVITDIPPPIEQAIMRCLEQDPEQRPTSAREVAASLPGGDLLAAATTAGETPGPELVAADSSGGEIGVRCGVSLLLMAAACAVALLILAPRAQVMLMARGQQSPQVLCERSREIARQVGYDGHPADSAWGMQTSREHLQFLARWVSTPRLFQQLRDTGTSPVTFWYRHSPRPLIASFSAAGTVVWPSDPPLSSPGDLSVELDLAGRLRSFAVVAVEQAQPGRETTPVDWAPLFTAAGLDQELWRPTTSRWLPKVPADSTCAWQGSLGQVPVQVAAASFQGRPVWFELIWPWHHDIRRQDPVRTWTAVAGKAVWVVSVFGLFALMALLARRNLRRGRGDAGTAVHLGVFMFCTEILAVSVGSHHAADPWLFWRWMNAALGQASLFAIGITLSYLAVEPTFRALWPTRLTSWCRLLAGKVHDPLVGRDLLIGVVLGAVVAASDQLSGALPGWLHVPHTGPSPATPGLGPLPHLLGKLLYLLPQSILNTFTTLAVLLGTKLVLRRTGLAIAATAGFWTVVNLSGGNALYELPWLAVAAGLTMLALMRFGLLCLTAFWFTLSLLLSTAPLTLASGSWYFPRTLAVMAVLTLLLLYGFKAAIGRRPLLDPELLER